MSRGSSTRFIARPTYGLASLDMGRLRLLRRRAHGRVRRVVHGVDDVRVAGAAAEISAEAFVNLLAARLLLVGEQADRRHDHSRRAEAALQAVTLPESLLHGVQLTVGRETFDRLDAGAIGLNGEHRARLDGLA